MTLEDFRKAQLRGILGRHRIPAMPGSSSNRQPSGAARIPRPLEIGPSIFVMGTTATAALPKQPFKMPAPLHDGSKDRRVNVVTWDLGASPPHFHDVIQGAIGNCPVGSILAALANTPTGKERIAEAVKEHAAVVVTDVSDVMKELDYTQGGIVPPNGRLTSKRYFSVDLPGIKQEVSDVFYTDDGDENPLLLYMGYQGVRQDKGEKAFLWPSVIEKAYAVQLGGYAKVDAVNTVEEAWPALVGTPPNGEFIAKLTDRDIMMHVQKAATVPTVAATLDDRNNQSVEKDSKGLLEGWHGYAVLGSAANRIKLYNPHGYSLPPLSLADFKKFFIKMFWL